MERSLRYLYVKKLIPITKYGQVLRMVDEGDADFIYLLRSNTRLSKYLSKIDKEHEKQIRWIKDYKIREKQGDDFYFMSCDPIKGEKFGVTRLYNFSDTIFEIGSWIFKPGLNISKAILADIIAKEIGFDVLNYEKCKFEVRKGNKSVIRYHQSFRPILLDEDNQNLYFELSKSVFTQNKYKLLKIAGYELNTRLY